jgi:F-box protein 21
MLCEYPVTLPALPLTSRLYCHPWLIRSYASSVQDDKSMRYVAEENIELLRPNEVDPDAFPLEIGKWFKRWDGVGRMFISNVRDEYPDD